MPNEEIPENETSSDNSDAKTGESDAALETQDASAAGKSDSQKELLYLRAEFENYKKRIIREQDRAIRFANEKLIAELITPIDLLSRAVQHAQPMKQRKDDKEAANLVLGIEMTQSELTQILSRFGVEFIGVAGEKFDPERHEAVSQIEVADESKAETLVEVLQKGCLLQGRLLKPARVVVAKKKEI